MAKLRVMDAVALGEYLIEVARNPEVRAELEADPKGKLGQFVKIPEEHTVVLHFDSEDETNVMIPWGGDIESSLRNMREQDYVYPLEYTPDSGAFIDPSDRYEDQDPVKEPPKAYKFRVGDYSLARCG